MRKRKTDSRVIERHELDRQQWSSSLIHRVFNVQKNTHKKNTVNYQTLLSNLWPSTTWPSLQIRGEGKTWGDPYGIITQRTTKTKKNQPLSVYREVQEAILTTELWNGHQEKRRKEGWKTEACVVLQRGSLCVTTIRYPHPTQKKLGGKNNCVPCRPPLRSRSHTAAIFHLCQSHSA